MRGGVDFAHRRSPRHQPGRAAGQRAAGAGPRGVPGRGSRPARDRCAAAAAGRRGAARMPGLDRARSRAAGERPVPGLRPGAGTGRAVSAGGVAAARGASAGGEPGAAGLGRRADPFAGGTPRRRRTGRAVERRHRRVQRRGRMVEAIVEQFDLGPSGIARAAELARNHAALRSPQHPAAPSGRFLGGVPATGRAAPGRAGAAIEPCYDWDDLVPAATSWRTCARSPRRWRIARRCTRTGASPRS